MSPNSDVLSELQALRSNIAAASDSSAHVEASSPDTQSKHSPDIERLIRELHRHLTDAADRAEEIVIEHPFVSVAAAFLLGVAVGRTLGLVK